MTKSGPNTHRGGGGGQHAAAPPALRWLTPNPRARRALAASGLAVLTTAGAVAAVGGAAQAGTPPAGPGNIEIFNKRSMVALEGYLDQAGEKATVEVIRGNDTIGIGTGTIDATGFLEFNHPGGECWIGVTPNIAPGDEIKVSFSESALTDSAITASPTVTEVEGSGFTPSDEVVEGDPENRVRGLGTVTITGTYDPLNEWWSPARFNIETVNPDNRDDKTPPGEDPGLVDARAMGISLEPDAEHPNGEAGAWAAEATADPEAKTITGTYTLYTQADYDRVLEGDHVFAAWMAGEEPAMGLTQNEFEEIPGPGMGGCPPSPDGQVPTAPTTAQLSSATGATSITVAWETPAQGADVTPPTAYRVAAVGGTFTGQEVAKRTGGNTATLDGLEAGATYEILIEAYNGRWSTPQSVGSIAVGSGTGGENPPPPPDTSTEAPAAPTGVAATANAAGGIDVSWTAADRATSYEVSATAQGGTPVTTTVQAPATEATMSGLTAGTTYSVSVTARNAGGDTPAAESVTVTTNGTVAPSAFNLTRVLTGHQSVTAEWTAAQPGNAASPVTGYEVAATPTGSGTKVTASVTGTTGTLTGLVNGVEYAVTVVAKSGEAFTTGTVPSSVDNTVTPNDVVTVGRAQFRDDRNEYRVTGTAQDTTANTVTVSLISRTSTGTRTSVVAANVAVAADGAWSISTRNGPQAGPSDTLTVTSSSGANLTGVPLERR